MRQLLVAGNWKMNETQASASDLASALAAEIPEKIDQVRVLVCPPFPYLSAVGTAIAGSGVTLGAQNAYFENLGAFTGEVAVEMLVDVGCRYVILGHSERRHVLGETDEIINRKVRAAVDKGLKAILCIGELLTERDSDQTEAVLDTQLDCGLAELDAAAVDDVVLAYEPVWAIGTGVNATPEQAENAHLHLRSRLATRYNSEVGEKMQILYGGSVQPENALSLLSQPNVDGALVGGASLDAQGFLRIVRAATQVAGQ